MSDRHYGGELGLHDEEDAEWKAVNDGAATLLEYEGESLGPILDSPKRRAKLVEEFRTRALARLVLLPYTDPQFKRNRERIMRDAERERITVEWDLGFDENLL